MRTTADRTTPAAIAALAAVLAAQEPTPPEPSAAAFAARRTALMEELGDGVVLLRGAPKPADMAVFYQDHEFYWLTGVAEPDAAAILLPAKGEARLYVPPFNRFTATWDGDRLVPGEDAAERTGFDSVESVRSLRRALGELLEGESVVWTVLSPSPGRTATTSTARAAAAAQQRDFLDGRPARHEVLQDRLTELFGVEVRDLTPILDRMRGVKDADEIVQIRAATHAAVQGLAEAIKSTEVGMYEYQIAACARYVFSRLGAGPDAYAAIVGAGPNGCVLHYSANSRKTRDGDLIVMDYGPTVHGYCTDVTRTFPANGTFTDAQRALVQDVYEIQRALIADVRPGARLSALSAKCMKMLLERGYKSFHGPCHHVGLAVHDLGGDVLEPGMVITVEPGAYLVDEGMGCRIEDTVVVTDDGCEVLSAALPADPDGIEALMRETGVAQQPVGLPRRGQ